MKLSKGLKWLSALLVTTSVVTTTVPVAAAPFSLFGSKEQLSDEDIQKIQEVYRSIREGYIEEIDKEKILEGALKGMVSATEDPYSEYFNKEESTAFDNAMSDSFEGIGVQFQVKGGEMVVISALDDTPASKAGLQPNDVIVSVDGTELKDKTTQEVMKLIRGPKGSEVKLVIRRGSSSFEVKLTRDTIPNYSVTSNLDEQDKTIAHIKIIQFGENTAKELENAVKKAREDGAKSFIFDLRNDPGGLLSQALAIGNMFLKDGDVILQTQERGSDPTVFSADTKLYGDFKITEPYVFLVDGGSASASEILAAAIKENTKHDLVGEKTFGKGTVQQVLNQSDLGELKLTIAKWLTPKGDWIHKQGIEPTVAVEQEPVAKAVSLSYDDTLAKGQSNDGVKNLALILKALGYELESTEYFDDKMEAAVKAFQKDKGLTEDGQVTGKTADALNEATREYLKAHDVQYDKAKEVLKQGNNS